MNNTITIDNVPEGYELTGEYREVRPGDLYLGPGSTVRTAAYNGAQWPILRKIEPPKAPEGYELTGEYRVPVTGEIYVSINPDYGPIESCLHSDWASRRVNDGKRWILRKAWQAPAWMPKGCWLFKGAMTGKWWVSKTQPTLCTSGGWTHGNGCDGIYVDILANLHGETFTPPPHTTCLQIQ